MTRLIVCSVLFALLAITPQPAHAYIDPGIGSLLFQSVVAAFVAAGAAWAGFKLKIADFFGRRKQEPDDEK
jgi:hypothetical protein